MPSLLSVLVSLLIAATMVGVFTLLKFKFNNRILPKVLKPCAVVLFVTALLRHLYVQTAVYYVKGLDHPSSPFNVDGPNPGLTAFALILVWLSHAAMLTTVLSAFFNFKTLRRIVNLFSLPVYAVILISYETYGIALLGREAFATSTVRFWMIAVEIGLGIAIAVGNIIDDGRFEVPRKPADFGNWIYGLFFAVLAIMPCNIPQAFFNQIDPSIKLVDLTVEHRYVLYGAIIVPIIIFHLLKNKPVEVNRMILTYMSLAIFWTYICYWNFQGLLGVSGPVTWPVDFLSAPPQWPLHLCNMAMILYPLCLVFNMKRLFNFCLFINVLGSVFAMVMPGGLEGINAIGTERISFWINHYAAFFMPVLMVSLKVFKRPKFKEWVYAVIALVAYFSLMLFTNAYLTQRFGVEYDYFFINGDFIVSALGDWAEKTRDLIWTVNFRGYELTFYPIYQTIFISSYILFSVGMWFLYTLLFSALDAEEDKRNRAKDYKRMKKDLKKYLGNKPVTESISGDTSPSLVIRNFSKRYGSNKHYSVNDVSFEVKGGEIFGFLGPNGAGKSTIIKSMVGIQTITSGNIEICGFDVEKQAVAAKMNTAFVPDHYALYENLTGREYINYIADLFGVSAEERDAFIDKYVDLFQLTGAFDNQMKTYSHGMKQKITIMSALVHNPKVWILDEPLTGLDPTSIHEVKECMKEHAAKGNIVFFSSHIIDVVEKLCDKIAIIKKGQLRAYISMKELNEQGIDLEQYYLNIIYDGNDEHVPYVETAPEADAEAEKV